MAWLFGGGTGQQPPIPPILGSLPPPPPGGGGDDGKNKNEGQNTGETRMDAYTFDSKALERAAKAAKDLEKSRKIGYDISA